MFLEIEPVFLICVPKHCVGRLCFKHYVANTVFKPTTHKHCVQHSVRAHKRSTKLCDECATHIVKMCDTYSVVIVGLNGAQGRNRTTDTRIFNAVGSRLVFDYCDLAYWFFGVRKSVFLVIWGWTEWEHCVEHCVRDSVRNTRTGDALFEKAPRKPSATYWSKFSLSLFSKLPRTWYLQSR